MSMKESVTLGKLRGTRHGGLRLRGEDGGMARGTGGRADIFIAGKIGLGGPKTGVGEMVGRRKLGAQGERNAKTKEQKVNAGARNCRPALQNSYHAPLFRPGPSLSQLGTSFSSPSGSPTR